MGGIGFNLDVITGELPFWGRLLLIAAVALISHLFVLLVRQIGQRVIRSEDRVHAKIRTVTSLAVSTLVFIIYFVALGLILHEFGISLTAYFASVSVIGIAVGFGSQGLVQDVVTGLTLIFSDLFDLGEMVELGGQTGVVKKLGIRFTVLTNFMGADVYIPNRTINNVINYPKGYIRAIVDFRLPQDTPEASQIEAQLQELTQGVYEQLAGVFRAPPSREGKHEVSGGKTFVRYKFRIWPGQGAPLETLLKKEVVEALKRIDPDYADWMVVIAYEVEDKVALKLQRRG